MGEIKAKRNESKERSHSRKIPRIEIELSSLQASLASLQTETTKTQNRIDNEALLGGVIKPNKQTLQSNTVLPTGYSGFVVGPLRIPLGLSLKINEGARLVIL